jgi:hypothetical protein
VAMFMPQTMKSAEVLALVLHALSGRLQRLYVKNLLKLAILERNFLYSIDRDLAKSGLLKKSI